MKNAFKMLLFFKKQKQLTSKLSKWINLGTPHTWKCHFLLHLYTHRKRPQIYYPLKSFMWKKRKRERERESERERERERERSWCVFSLWVKYGFGYMALQTVKCHSSHNKHKHKRAQFFQYLIFFSPIIDFHYTILFS
jgi:hypothetical protein